MSPAGPHQGSSRHRLSELVDAWTARQEALRSQLAGRRADLPLRFWRQQAHLTAPASRDIAHKALAGGTAPTARIMERLGVTSAMLAERLELPQARIDELLERPRLAPVVMLDAEDALAPTQAAAEAGRRDAIDVLGETVDHPGPPSLRFFRPPGLADGATARELLPVLWGLVERHGPDHRMLDAVVYPKIEHPEEVDLVHEMLDEAETELGLASGSIRTAYLVESGAAVVQLERIAMRAAGRLCALIFGLADYSADLGLPMISDDHPAAAWSRARIVAVAAAVGVPAIDGMTLAYPVADPSLDATANRERFVARMALVYHDAVRARREGMLGKWVGHPAQLFATLLAADASLDPDALAVEAARLDAYRAAVDSTGSGATIIDGAMADRATDRHARVVLRQAVAVGRFEPQRAHELGVIDATELEQLATED
jgi:citrate lyase subunit beta/citryl-CoA lyase